MKSLWILKPHRLDGDPTPFINFVKNLPEDISLALDYDYDEASDSLKLYA
ncbi:hypothetical protein FACS1894120_6200 [Clostridia bacterium]|nr:hypothetical protein FACS1894120_6200 [Clostridia bacterium]